MASRCGNLKWCVGRGQDMRRIHLSIAIYSLLTASLLAIALIVRMVVVPDVLWVSSLGLFAVICLLVLSSYGIILKKGFGFWIGGAMYTAQIFTISTSIVKWYLVPPISLRFLYRLTDDNFVGLFGWNAALSADFSFALFLPTKEMLFGMDFFAVAIALILWREVDRRAHRARNPEDPGGPVEFAS